MFEIEVKEILSYHVGKIAEKAVCVGVYF